MRTEHDTAGPIGLRSSGNDMLLGTRCLLDLDTDLAEELELQAMRAARAAATAPILEAEPGSVALGDWLARAAPGPGVLVLDGAIAVTVRVCDRVAAELVGAGDLLQPGGGHCDEMLSCELGWRALLPTRVAVLDQAFSKRVRFWPQLTQALLRRAGQRTRNLNVQRAIAAQPRLEARLVLLLWHFATRWGKVEPGGIRLAVPLTHQLLGQLVAAERPSVSHALARLVQAGVLSGHSDEWHLHGSIKDQRAATIEPGAANMDRLVTAAASLVRH